MAKHNEIGRIGEKVAEEYLVSKGHTILSRNYRKPYGEIDLVSRKDECVHFVEVKSVSWETGESAVSERHRPEENVHPQKIKRLLRTIESYILERNVVGDWQFDVIAVYLDEKTKTAKVRFLENVVLGS
ncbi:YraN family protein [Patescibacteria group bacterium]|nr:YraN family protein [Patescibacteria group bacterium]